MLRKRNGKILAVGDNRHDHENIAERFQKLQCLNAFLLLIASVTEQVPVQGYNMLPAYMMTPFGIMSTTAMMPANQMRSGSATPGSHSPNATPKPENTTQQLIVPEIGADAMLRTTPQETAPVAVGA